ncbi:MAG: hypothetical protein JXB39_05945 [Deltaproteobacteria bacterium]|nr:hypothetical protein [Deltaproteobacteria bacterium]
MPVDFVALRPEALLHCDPRAPADAWRTLLVEAGFFVDLPPELPPDSPLAGVRATRHLLARLQARENDSRVLRTPAVDPGIPVPRWAWVLGALYAIALIAVSTMPTEMEDRWKVFGAGWALAAGAALLILLVILIHRLHNDRARARACRAAETEAQALSARLVPAVTAVLARSFVAPAGDRLIECTPHLSWMRAQAASARNETRSRRRKAACALADELDAEALRVEDVLATYRSVPPPSWTDRGLAPDPAPFLERLRALEVPASPLAQAIEAAWAGERDAT